MPPKAKKTAPAAPAPSPSLKDCRIAFVSLTNKNLNGSSKDQVQKFISDQGGELVTKIEQCTHFIADKDQYKKQLARVQTAIAKSDVHIVTYDWLQKSFTASQKVDEVEYLLHDRNANSQANDTTTTTGNKRPRAAADDEDTTPDTKKKVKAEQNDPDPIAPAVSVNVPIDDGVPDAENYIVFVGDDSTVYDATLNQTNAGNNNNKYYRIQLLVDRQGKNWCWTRWGRVGERGQTKMLGDGDFDLALKEFGKKFKDKNGNTWEERLEPIKSGKYAYIERSYEDSDDDDDRKTSLKSANTKTEEQDEEEPPRSKLVEPVQRLMKLIFNQEFFDSTLASLDYDANKMPLGKLSKNTLLRGYAVLKDIAASIGSGNSGNIADMSNQYFSLIPHAFGRNCPPVLNNMTIIKREVDLLESLTDMQLANEIMKSARGKKGVTETVNVLDRQFDGLGMKETTPLDPKSNEFTELQNYLANSSGHTHNLTYKVQDIFRIERRGETDRFDASKFAKVPNSDRRLLWHGSRCTNFGGILSQGLRIAPPEAPVNGYMFGKGVYLADMSSKSANYCCAHVSGGTALLLLCEAELGKPPLKLINADSNAAANAEKQGSISTWGVGMHAPQGWKDAGCVHKDLVGVLMPDVVSKPPGPTNEAGSWLQYNEYIVYDVAQVKLKYLLRCQIN